MALIEELKERRKAIKGEAEALIKRAEVAHRAMTAAEDTQFNDLIAESKRISERIDELEESRTAESAAARHRVETNVFGGGTGSGVGYTRGREVYGPDSEFSFFRDLATSQRGDLRASERLATNNDIRGYEFRSTDMSTSAGQGGEWAPPLWLVDEWVALARPYEITANIVHREELPSGVSSINLPKVSGGSTVAVQQTQGTAVSDTAVTSTSVTSGITTFAGKQLVSNQLIFQSAIPFDKVILSDLAADTAKQLNNAVLNGTGSSGQLRGIRSASGAGTTTFTTTQPSFVSTTSANSFYNKVISAIATVNRTRYSKPTHIVMHSDRWAWVLETLDSQNRPLVVPDGMQFNGPAVSGEVTSGGIAGTLAGLPVVTDPQVLQNLGGSTNQDEVYVLKADDVYLWTTPPMLETFAPTFADQNVTLFRAVQYASMIPDRYGASVNIISGTGMVVPSL